MRMTTIEKEKEINEFAARASINFSENKKNYTYTDDDIEPGCLFAVRFGADNNCVVVFRLDEYFEPVNFQQIIRG